MWNLLHRHKIGAARRFLTWADSTKSRNLILRSLVSKSTAAPPVEEAKRDKSVRKAPAFDFATMGEFELTSFLKVSERSKIDVSPKLSDILRTLQRCSRYEKPDSLAAAAYALRHSDGSHAGAFGLVEVLAIRIRSCRDTFNTIQICKIMSGVRFMSSDHVHVRAYIDATCLAIKRSEDSLNPRFFGVVLYSLKSMNCDSPEVRKLLKVISGKLEIYVEPLDGQCIGNMLYGLRGMSSVHSEVKALLSAIAFKIPELTTEMTSQELGNALYGLQKMSSDAKEVREVMFALSNQLTRYFNQYDESINAAPRDEDDDDDNGDLKKLLNSNRVSNFSMSPQLISNALYGLQNMSDSMRDTRYVLAAILPAIKNPTEPFSSLAVGLALYGLQSMTANSVEVRRVLDALATQIELCNEPFNAQTLGNALYGLKSMDSDSDEIRRLLSAFSNQLRKNIGNQKLTGQSIGNALYGLKNMQGDVVEVQELVALLADAIKHSDAQLSAQAVGNAIYGLSCMSSNEESVLHLLEALTVKVKSSQGKLNSQAIASALYGLQNMSSTSKQVRQLLLALSIKINECEDPANDRLIGNALYGLKSISLSDGYEVRLIVSALTEYFFCSTKAYRPDGTLIPMLHTSNIFDRKGFKENKMYDIIKSDNVRGVIPLSGKSVGMGLYGLRRMSSNYFEAKNLLAALMPSICATSSGLDGQFIGNSMYGIQNMSCSVSEVRTLLNFMTSKLKSSEVGILSGQELAISLFGCRSMEGCDELKQFLGAISYHLSECTDVLSPLAISECFVGMQNIPFYEEKKFLFAQLSDRIDKCVDPFSIDIIAMACYGFKLHDESFESEIKGILNKFHKVVLENKMVLAPHHCANFLFGLRGCPRSGDGLLSLAFDWILAANKQLTLSDIAADKLLNSYNLDLWRNLNQSVQLYLETDSSLPVDKKNMLEHFCIRLNNLLPVKGNVSEINHVEQNVFSSIKKCMENIQDVHITEHEFLHSFQCDIIVRYANLNGEEIILNVEIDGLTHERSTKRNFCNLRDNFLRKRGIQVLRINFKGRQAKMDLEVKKAIDFVKRSIISSRIR